MALKYTGYGFIYGIPARDLTDEEVEEYGGEEWLLSTKQYSKEEPNKKAGKPVKEADNGGN